MNYIMVARAIQEWIEEKIAELNIRWLPGAFGPPAEVMQAEMPNGRLQVSRHARPPTSERPFEGTFRGVRVGFYRTMPEGRAALELWWFADLGRKPPKQPEQATFL